MQWLDYFSDEITECKGQHTRGQNGQNNLPSNDFLLLALASDILNTLVHSMLVKLLFNFAHLFRLNKFIAVTLRMQTFAPFGRMLELYKTEIVRFLRQYLPQVVCRIVLLLLLAIVELIILPFLHHAADIFVINAFFVITSWLDQKETFEQIQQRLLSAPGYIERWLMTLDFKVQMRTAR